jgi:phosphatidate phosphatase APP1
VMGCAWMALGGEIKSDERVVLFPSMAWQGSDGQWQVEIRGWIGEPEPRPGALLLFRTLLGIREAELTEIERTFFTQRAKAFLVDNERNKKIRVRLHATIYPLSESQADGHFSQVLRFAPAEWKEINAGGNRRQRVEAIVGEKQSAAISAPIHVYGREGISVISDIDDTIKITDVRNRSEALRNTFLRAFKPVEGMATSYRLWAENHGALFHYVSGSPWPLFPDLEGFVRTNGFPEGTFHLRTLAWSAESFSEFLGPPDEFKLRAIEDLLRRFPERRFLLVGDSGERDPEIYGAIARKFPEQIAGIFIREVASESQDRWETAFAGLPEKKWSLFWNAPEIRDWSPTPP